MNRGHRPTSLRGELRTSWRLLLASLSVMLVSVVGASGYLVIGLQPELDRQNTVVRQLRLAHEGLLDQETGLRAYVATGQGSFLQPYVRGRQESALAEDTLLRGVGRQGPIADRVVRMLLAENQWRTGWAETAVRVPAGRPLVGGALAAFLTQGKTFFDTYRADEASALGRSGCSA